MEINAENDKPYVFLNKNTCNLTIKGKSYPTHALEFYNPIEDKSMNFINDDICENLTITLYLEIMNSISTKCIFSLIKNVSEIKNVVINWYYESDDEDIREEGKHFSDLLPKTIFKLIKVEVN